ncbi:reverse transcriptase/maturase family protein [Methylocystis hirsuta]|uniref:reverse transcriptase/maturase family protein n=1 Tax=Methylocystis hirsuta TaxID=369798 RepID=UPI001475D66B|nr:reverse transcriptase/maturase family protein [Methylocystis hirsuta]
MQFSHPYEDIISVENLLAAWTEFLRGKRQKPDVQAFHHQLMENILALHRELRSKIYRHGDYHHFRIADPKPRDIHKAAVRDRLLHHALYRQLYPFFDRAFIADSYSCRVAKGTHRAMNRFRALAYRVSRNHTRTACVLKCDVRKFFASIDHRTLLDIVSRRVPDADTMWLVGQVVRSFDSGVEGKGLPLGNLTSQLFANVYMNEFDQFVKHTLKARYYIRYADDFVILTHDRGWLEELIPRIESFLMERLGLQLHPKKVSIHTVASGVDFLGWVHFPDHRVLRTTTKRRMLRNVGMGENEARLRSYLGLLTHGNAEKLQNEVRNRCVGA